MGLSLRHTTKYKRTFSTNKYSAAVHSLSPTKNIPHTRTSRHYCSALLLLENLHRYHILAAHPIGGRGVNPSPLYIVNNCKYEQWAGCSMDRWMLIRPTISSPPGHRPTAGLHSPTRTRWVYQPNPVTVPQKNGEHDKWPTEQILFGKQHLESVVFHLSQNSLGKQRTINRKFLSTLFLFPLMQCTPSIQNTEL